MGFFINKMCGKILFRLCCEMDRIFFPREMAPSLTPHAPPIAAKGKSPLPLLEKSVTLKPSNIHPLATQPSTPRKRICQEYFNTLEKNKNFALDLSLIFRKL